jgi:hypothetical protein
LGGASGVAGISVLLVDILLSGWSASVDTLLILGTYAKGFDRGGPLSSSLRAHGQWIWSESDFRYLTVFKRCGS